MKAYLPREIEDLNVVVDLMVWGTKVEQNSMWAKDWQD
jgi:hypothetical protein